MWDRIEMKRRGKQAFLNNYWICVLATFLLMLTVGTDFFQVRFDLTNRRFIYDGLSMFRRLDINGNPYIIYIGLVAAAVIAVLGVLLDLFVMNVLTVGGCSFFLDNQTFYADVSTLLSGFRNGHYKNVVTTMFLRDLYIFLWMLLFLVPGIIKSYEYRMVPYILAEHPEMPPNEVIAASREMMDGYKYETFVLDLSFLGWMLLGSLTFGIAGIFFVEPYINATDAEIYSTLKRIDDMQVVYQM